MPLEVRLDIARASVAESVALPFRMLSFTSSLSASLSAVSTIIASGLQRSRREIGVGLLSSAVPDDLGSRVDGRIPYAPRMDLSTSRLRSSVSDSGGFAPNLLRHVLARRELAPMPGPPSHNRRAHRLAPASFYPPARGKVSPESSERVGFAVIVLALAQRSPSVGSPGGRSQISISPRPRSWRSMPESTRRTLSRLSTVGNLPTASSPSCRESGLGHHR